jgi:hypothetical protein
MDFIQAVITGLIVFGFFGALASILILVAEQYTKWVEGFFLSLIGIPFFWFVGKVTLKLMGHAF